MSCCIIRQFRRYFNSKSKHIIQQYLHEYDINHYYKTAHSSRFTISFSPGFSTGTSHPGQIGLNLLSRHLPNRERCKFWQTKKKLASSRVPELGAGTRFMHKNLMTIIISKSITTTSQSQQRTNHAQINFLTYTYLGKKKRTKLSAAPLSAVRRFLAELPPPGLDAPLLPRPS